WRKRNDKQVRGEPMRHLILSLVPLILFVGALELHGHAVASCRPAQKTAQIVLLGTGTPNADPARSGPSVAIVVNDTPYLVDFGPGVVRRAAAAFEKGIKGLE